MAQDLKTSEVRDAHDPRKPARRSPTSPASATSSPRRRGRARCRSAATARSARRSGSMPSRFPAPSFTAPRAENRRTWTYRIRPSVVHRPYARIDNGLHPQRAVQRGRRDAVATALEPASDPEQADRLRRRHRHARRQRRRRARRSAWRRTSMPPTAR